MNTPTTLSGIRWARYVSLAEGVRDVLRIVGRYTIGSDYTSADRYVAALKRGRYFELDVREYLQRVQWRLRHSTIAVCRDVT